jgi:DNA-binding beta-propeller fold protein YncE
VARDQVYVTDPDAGRVLVYNTLGECLGSFGQASREGFDATQFRTTAGITVGADGQIYIADSGTGRVLRFPPFEAGTAPAVQDSGASGGLPLQLDEVTDEVGSGVEATEPVEAAG